MKDIRSTNPVAVGDRVRVKDSEDGLSQPFICGIEPRRNHIVRKAVNLSKESHILAANIDLAVLVITVVWPPTETTFIDRFLATAEAYDVPVVLAFNKVDLCQEPTLREALEEMMELYSRIGYPTMAVSATEHIGIDELRQLLIGKISLLAGHSGVGKSSLINALAPHLQLRVGDISLAHGTGTHTTTLSEMLPLDSQDLSRGFIIDTPGIKGFGTLEMNESNTSHFFREFFALSAGCRFGNCTHINEPSCAVLAALKDGRIAPSRYMSYLSILQDQQEGKYRES